MALNYQKLMAHRSPEARVGFAPRDCILYALGIGLGMDPVSGAELQFVYEKKLKAFPTMPVILGWSNLLAEDDFGVDRRMIVNAGLKVENHRVLPTEGVMIGNQQVAEVIDRGPDGHAIVQIVRQLADEDGAAVATVATNLLLRKHGGFGGPVTEAPAEATMPERPPDSTVEFATPRNLALLYRLNGDMNPLHAEPELARKVGFAAPILHGAATFGIAARAVLASCADNRPERLQSIAGSFRRPVVPGDTISTDLWQEGSRILFQCRIEARDEVVLSGGEAALTA